MSSDLTVGLVYLPFDDPDLAPTRAVKYLVMSSRASKSQLVISCDANAHHITGEHNNNNPNGESLLQFVMPNNLYILNGSSVSTFMNSKRKEISHIMLPIMQEVMSMIGMYLMRRVAQITFAYQF